MKRAMTVAVLALLVGCGKLGEREQASSTPSGPRAAYYVLQNASGQSIATVVKWGASSLGVAFGDGHFDVLTTQGYLVGITSKGFLIPNSYYNAASSAAYPNDSAPCLYTTNDCTGTCYLSETNITDQGILKGTLLYDGTRYYVRTGLETVSTQGISSRSFVYSPGAPAPSCTVHGSPISQTVFLPSQEITAPFNLPLGDLRIVPAFQP